MKSSFLTILFSLTIALIGCKKDPAIKPIDYLPVAGNYLPLTNGTTRTYASTHTPRQSEIIDGDSLLFGKTYKKFRYDEISNSMPKYCKEGHNYYKLYNVFGIYYEYLVLKDDMPVGYSWVQYNFDGRQKTTYTVLDFNINKVVGKLNFKNVIRIRSEERYDNVINSNILDHYYSKDIGLIYENSITNPFPWESSLIEYEIK